MSNENTTHTPVRNRDLFYRIADHIERNPEGHRQSSWGSVKRPIADPSGATGELAAAIRRREAPATQPEFAQLLAELELSPLPNGAGAANADGCLTAFCISGWGALLCGDDRVKWRVSLNTHARSGATTSNIFGEPIILKADQQALLDRAVEAGYLERAIGHYTRAVRDQGYDDDYFAWVLLGMELLGITFVDAMVLFDSDWEPSGDYSVPDALRRYGDGETLRAVTNNHHWDSLMGEPI